MKRALQHFLCGLLVLGLLWIPLAYSVLGMFGIGVAL